MSRNINTSSSRFQISKASTRPIGQNNALNKKRMRTQYRTIELKSWLTSRSTITLAPFRKLGIYDGYKYVPQSSQIQAPYHKEYFIAGKNLLLTVITDKKLFKGTDRNHSSSESSSCESSVCEFSVGELSSSEFSSDDLSSSESSTDNSSSSESSESGRSMALAKSLQRTMGGLK